MSQTAPIEGGTWVLACDCDDIDDEDVIRFDQGGNTYAVYRVDEVFFTTQGNCTHEEQHLAEGLMDAHVIQCPLHLAEFDIGSGKNLSGPVCPALQTYEVKVEDGNVFILI